MKRIIILLSLLASIGVQAQGCLKGTVTDAKTGELLPFVNVTVLKDGKQVHGGTTDYDGIFTIKPLEADTYDIEINNVGYIRYRRERVRVYPEGFTLLEIQLNQIDSARLEEITITLENYGSQDGAMLVPLPEYKIVSRELKRLLDRVIDGKCNTYGYKVPRRRIKRGETCNLYLFSTERIDTSWSEDYLYMLHSEDSTLPMPIKEPAPKFSFDSASIVMIVTTTYHPDAFDHDEGYVKYRGRIFFLVYPVEDLGLLKRREGKGDLFKYREIPTWARRDPPTWIYTKQQGAWYRWMEYPKGF
ncbi:MAG: carboxypeptidase regulatory-like domain-containing protein [Bacteroidales bacterium]|nr:carboxypeptidase regulatory-like domain-containing protein [Bacteroidales bacterium]